MLQRLPVRLNACSSPRIDAFVLLLIRDAHLVFIIPMPAPAKIPSNANRSIKVAPPHVAEKNLPSIVESE